MEGGCPHEDGVLARIGNPDSIGVKGLSRRLNRIRGLNPDLCPGGNIQSVDRAD
jgi:hypothetical protein